LRQKELERLQFEEQARLMMEELMQEPVAQGQPKSQPVKEKPKKTDWVIEDDGEEESGPNSDLDGV